MPFALRPLLSPGKLDRRLLAGADPHETQALASRVDHLVSRRHRHLLASGLRRVVATAEKPRRGFSAVAPIQRGPVLAARARLVEVAELLDGDEPVSPRGIIVVERLLTDGTSAIYTPSAPGELDAAVRHARVTLLVER